ncbi:carbohydrate kinase [Lichenihabitans sp. Uapishka_5]|uniref:FGGY-family carbohydrate kinase n=1 Tax=Lichenihabitans sp. Uapishka_5 TaxID=3037302 RepID=UPI0029E7F5C2|nr:FGGY-family carbohydrate kinase [Lichenihabitans sp. Uapishka_5]MDX7950288.1 carbohydrate kinase [Lichenihabitans sp. Uapishka_5]
MLIGIDLGTSMIKAAAFSLDGEILAVASRRAVLRHLSTERIEQDFEEIVTAVGIVVSEVRAATTRTPIAVGITGQSDGLWLLDHEGRAVRPAISWLDGRGNRALQRWMDDGTYEAVFRRNGNAIFAGSQAPLMAALAEAEPESLRAAATASYVKDGILQRLTGVRATDPSDASLPFLDTRTRRYDPEILRLLGLEPHSHLLAPVDASPGRAYPLNAAGAALTGLPLGLPVHAGPFDMPACAIGAGVNELGDGLITIGTTLACQVLVGAVDTGGEPMGMTLCMPKPDRWLRAAPAMVGTASLDWILALVGVRPDGLEALLAESVPGARGVSALPYFAATGERAPFCDVSARGQLAGLSMGTTRADLVTAVCESVAYAARHCIEAAGFTGRLSVCGGGSGSRVWCQMIADVLQVPLHIARRPEVGARGTVMATMDVLGIAYDHAAWTRSESVVEPRSQSDHYEDGFAHYLETVDAARHLWHSPARERLTGRMQH